MGLNVLVDVDALLVLGAGVELNVLVDGEALDVVGVELELDVLGEKLVTVARTTMPV